MSRDWLAAYCGILGKPKYRRLSIPARAGLFHVWLLAGAQTPEATWPSRDDLAEALDLDGYPVDVVDELLSRHWLDTEPDGSVTVHDWDEWQFAASQAIARAWEAARLRSWRRKAKARDPLSPAPLSPDSDKTGHNRTGLRTSTDDVRTNTKTNGVEACARCHKPFGPDLIAGMMVVDPESNLVLWCTACSEATGGNLTAKFAERFGAS